MSDMTDNVEITKNPKAPYVSSYPLMILAFLAEWIPGISKYLFYDSGFADLRKFKYEDSLTSIPLPLPKEKFGLNKLEHPVVGLEIFDEKGISPESIGSTGYLTAWHLREAYLSGRITPSQVAERFLERIEAAHTCTSPTEPSIEGFYQYEKDEILKQAEESTARYAQKKSLGPLDGVPIGVKDELDVKGFETRVGTIFINRGNKAQRDATLIHRLRERGAIIAGKTSMHELGMDITGNNPKAKTPRNPYDPNHYCGGSSGGSAAIVASGLCPIAIGCDGGGSVRVPASFCGVYGLKPTTGRISSIGEFPFAWTCAVPGPFASSADDLALAYYAIAGKDPEDPITYHQPSPTLYGFYLTNTLSDLKIGIYSAWNRQVLNPAITTVLHEFIDAFKLRGAQFVEIEIPELEEARNAHLISILSEVHSSLNRYKEHRTKITYPNRIIHCILDHLTASDYIQSQQVRTRSMRYVSDLFENSVDLILTPTTGITAPQIYPRSLLHGELNANVSGNGVRYVQLANLTGIPGINVPAGYDDKGLPIGLQFMAKWYNEALLLRVAKTSQEILGDRRKQPREGLWFGDLL
ncbi:11576_t:CDS:10 [Ambispora gerdemannii]|uniref:11576_t:CDS:1 n=1 Tax=Ambispora gerdemannii TaxID=144530 RepID=A0A9N9F552_9GLOM|nr:11576_t:CDS:10 [Ambispora gerdemannii]